MKEVLFVCQGNVGRSQMAEAFYNCLTESDNAISAGIDDVFEKYGGQPTEEIIETMAEEGIDISKQRIKQLNEDMLGQAEKVVVLCDKKICPDYLVKSSDKILFIPIKDPQPETQKKVRKIRNKIKNLVIKIIEDSFMLNHFTNIFHIRKPIIAMIHLPPLIGYKGYPGFEFIKKKTLEEVKILSSSGVHSIMVENNYDIPHKEFVDPEVAVMTAVLTQLVVDHTMLPVGINVLWNDYRSALGICATTGARFMRIPAFVDDVRTVYGDMKQRAEETVAYQKKLGLSKVAIFADVQVKHSEMIDKNKPLSLSVKQAYEKGAQAIIVTGRWTGDAPKLDDLEVARKTAGRRPILIGSGSTPKNLEALFKFTDGVIVGTSIMTKGKVDKSKLATYMSVYNSLKKKRFKPS